MKIPYPLLRDMIWCSFACEVLGMACYLYYGVFLEWPICQHALKLQVHKQMMIDTLLRPEPPPTFYMVQAYLQIISCPTICQFVHSTFIMVSCSDHSPFAIFFPTSACYENLAFVTQCYDLMDRHLQLISDYIGAYKSPFLWVWTAIKQRKGVISMEPWVSYSEDFVLSVNT
jgi:hypothetical protein